MKNITIQPRRGASLQYGHVRLSPREQISLHQQPTWELSFVMSGEGMRQIGDTREPFRAGEVVLVVPEMPHCWEFDPAKTDAEGKIENVSIMFSSDLLEYASLMFPELSAAMDRLMNLKDSLKFLDGTAKAISDTMLQMERETDAERVTSLLRILILMGQGRENLPVGSFVAPKQAADRLKEVEVYVNCNYKRNITVEQVSAHIGMNRTSFCSFFKKEKGMTFITYLNKYRLDLACYFLTLPDLSISEACYQAGYNDIPYFTRLFKKTFGVSPSEYRVQHLQK